MLHNNYKYFRGISTRDYKIFLKTGKLPPSTDLIPFDNEVLEYAIGEDYGEMEEEQIDEWVKDMIPWYNGSYNSVAGGVNLTTDFENAQGYGDYVVAIADHSDIVDVSDAHSFAKSAADLNVLAVYDVNKRKWIS